MIMDISDFNKEIQEYPQNYLTPSEQEAVDILLNVLIALFGVKVNNPSQQAKMELVKVVVSGVLPILNP